MLTVWTFLALALSHEPVLELLPSDRTRVPPHCADRFSLQEWRQMPEISPYIRWREHRQFETWERLEREDRQHTRAFNPRMRAFGQEVPPDPVEPTEPFWKRIQQIQLKKDR